MSGGEILTVRLSRVDAQPWGFRLQGGKDFGTPLLIQKVRFVVFIVLSYCLVLRVRLVKR